MRILHWLEISNFKSYGTSGRIPLDHPSVLIGPNNCGKTTALKEIWLDVVCHLSISQDRLTMPYT